MALISCPECGLSVSDKAPRCPRCGMPINTQAQPTPSRHTASSPTPNNNGTGKTIAIIVSIVAVALLAIFLTTFFLMRRSGGQPPIANSETPAYTSTEDVAAPVEEPSPEPDTRSTIGNAYISTVQNAARNYARDESCFYFLFDINGDQTPELWVKTGTCEADYMMKVYRYENGECKKIHETGAGHSAFYAGSNYILLVTAHMGSAIWTKITSNGNRITETEIFEEDLFSSGKEDYTEPRERMVSAFPLNNMQPIKSAFGM